MSAHRVASLAQDPRIVSIDISYLVEAALRGDAAVSTVPDAEELSDEY
ncbi:hypothetical protein [Microbacterium sp. NPDC057650]